jgi:hypothetical protein
MKFTTIAAAKKETGLSYLGNINVSSKLAKNAKVFNTYTYCIYLAPAKTSGYNVCPYSTPECRLGCLATSGRAGMELIANKTTIHDCRIKKTRLLKEHTHFFMQWMIAEINGFIRKAKRDNVSFSIRLNGTSDIDWRKIFIDGKNIFNIFPDVQFYDYTKNPNKFSDLPNNYHLTFSYTGRNATVCKALLQKGFNVAVVFNLKKNESLPAMFGGYKVIDGEVSDFRPKDIKGVILGLKFKRIADKYNEMKILNSPFVVNPETVIVLETSKKLVMV